MREAEGVKNYQNCQKNIVTSFMDYPLVLTYDVTFSALPLPTRTLGNHGDRSCQLHWGILLLQY